MSAINHNGNREKFINGMSNAACTVNVVATDGPSGRAGLTVSAMSSVSADPPSLLVCIHGESRAGEILLENGVFSVNVLNDDQHHISDTFAGRSDQEDKFACSQWDTLATGSPALRDALVAFDCKLQKSFKWGSHHILIGNVEDIRIRQSGNPLIYANRAYGRAISIQPEQEIRSDGDSRIFRLGCFVTISAFFSPALVAQFRHEHTDAKIKLVEGPHASLMNALKDDDLDAAIMYLQAGRDDGGLEVDTLTEVPPYALLPARHPVAQNPSVSLTQLAEYPMVSLQKPSGGSGYIDNLFRQAGLTPLKKHTAPSFEVLRGMVAHGLGYAITVTKPASNMSYDGAALVRRPIIDPVEPARLVMLHKPADQLSPESSGFIDFCRGYFKGLATS